MSIDVRIWKQPNTPENGEARIRGCIGLLTQLENEVLRTSNIVHGIAAHPDVDDVAETLDKSRMLLTEAIDLLGHLDLCHIFDCEDDPDCVHVRATQLTEPNGG